MTKYEYIKFISDHPHYQRLADRLNDDEIDLMINFIDLYKDEGRAIFEMKLNRLFLDKKKPKNWSIILELLSIYNTRRCELRSHLKHF